jgi:hypothetical protein
MAGLDNIDYNFDFDVSPFAGPEEVKSTLTRPPVPATTTLSVQQGSDVIDLTMDYPGSAIQNAATETAMELPTNSRSSAQSLVPSVYWSTSSSAASSSTSLTSQYHSSAESLTARSGFRVVTPKRRSWRT